MRWLLPLIALAACAPVRDPVGGDAGFNSYETALFTIIDYGDWAEYQEAYVVLVDAEWGCDQLDWGGRLPTWQLPNGTRWYQAHAVRGINHPGWEGDYPSQAAWSASGGQWGPDVLWWAGEYGLVSNEESPAPGRDQYDTMGIDAAEADDQLSIRREGADGGVSGDVDGEDGRWDFDTEFCGVFSEVVIGR